LLLGVAYLNWHSNSKPAMSSTSSSDVESGETLTDTEREAGAAVPSVDGVDESANIPRRKLRQRLHDWVDETIDGFREHDRSRQEAAYGATGEPPLRKNLKTIQLQFIAFGGAIGMRSLAKKTPLEKPSANEST
jgi:amino acid permease